MRFALNNQWNGPITVQTFLICLDFSHVTVVMCGKDRKRNPREFLPVILLSLSLKTIFAINTSYIVNNFFSKQFFVMLEMSFTQQIIKYSLTCIIQVRSVLICMWMTLVSLLSGEKFVLLFVTFFLQCFRRLFSDSAGVDFVGND